MSLVSIGCRHGPLWAGNDVFLDIYRHARHDGVGRLEATLNAFFCTMGFVTERRPVPRESAAFARSYLTYLHKRYGADEAIATFIKTFGTGK